GGRERRRCGEHARHELAMGEPGGDEQCRERRCDERRDQPVRRPEVRGTGDDRQQRSRRSSEGGRAQPRTGGEGRHRSSARRRLRSRSGRALVTYGTVSKLCGGGGEVVYHSSVSASHGSLPARTPFRRTWARQMLITKTSTLSA